MHACVHASANLSGGSLGRGVRAEADGAVSAELGRRPWKLVDDGEQRLRAHVQTHTQSGKT
eukprot:2670150-Pleurochrysis_carterae.AAC.1